MEALMAIAGIIFLIGGVGCLGERGVGNFASGVLGLAVGSGLLAAAML